MTGVGRLAIVGVVILGVGSSGIGDQDLRVEIGDPLAHHCWNTMSSSLSGTSIMVTECPLFTAWALAASCPVAVLVVTACLTVCAPSSWCPGGVLGQELQFPEAPSLMAKDRAGTVGRIHGAPLGNLLTPSFSSGPGKSLVICSPGPSTGEVVLFFVKAPFRPGDLHFDCLVGPSVTRGDFTKAILSKLPVRLGPCGGTLLSCEVTLSE